MKSFKIFNKNRDLVRTVLLLPCLLLGLTGCPRHTLGAAESILSLSSVAASVGTEILPPEACIWIIGRAGPAMGMRLVLAHGGITVEECLRLGGP